MIKYSLDIKFIEDCGPDITFTANYGIPKQNIVNSTYPLVSETCDFYPRFRFNLKFDPDPIQKSGYLEGLNPDPDIKMLDPSKLDPDPNILIF